MAPKRHTVLMAFESLPFAKCGNESWVIVQLWKSCPLFSSVVRNVSIFVVRKPKLSLARHRVDQGVKRRGHFPDAVWDRMKHRSRAPSPLDPSRRWLSSCACIVPWLFSAHVWENAGGLLCSVTPEALRKKAAISSTIGQPPSATIGNNVASPARICAKPHSWGVLRVYTTETGC